MFLTSPQGMPMLLNPDHLLSDMSINCWEMWGLDPLKG